MTEATKWTAGPWMAAAKPSSIVGWPVVAPHAGGRMICDVALAPKPADTSDGEWSRHYVEVEANARLIAASPDMAEALLAMVRIHEQRDPATNKPIPLDNQPIEVIRARAALAKGGVS